jgi:RNA polymerase sigma-70 factor (ECF subfamily)
MNDRHLIKRLLGGRAGAFRTIDGWINIILRSRFRSLRSEWDDLRQEVQIRLYRNLRRGDFQGGSALRTYVHRMASNVCVDASRRAFRRREVSGVDLGSEERSVEPEVEFHPSLSRDLVQSLLAGLTTGERRLMRLVFVEQRSYREVAQELRIPSGTVKSRVSRCKRKPLRLRRQLSGKV